MRTSGRCQVRFLFNSYPFLKLNCLISLSVTGLFEGLKVFEKAGVSRECVVAVVDVCCGTHSVKIG